MTDATVFKATSDELARKIYEIALLRRVSSLAAHADSPTEVLQACVDGLCALAGFSVGHAVIASPDKRTLVSAGVWHVAPPASPEKLRALVDGVELPPEGLLGRVWRSGEPQWSRDDDRLREIARARLFEGRPPRGVFGFPVIVEGETAAALELYTCEETTPGEDLRELAAGLGEQVARVIERHRARERLARLTHELRNPLAAIRNGVALFRARREKLGSIDPETQRWLEDMLDRQTDELRRILDDVRDRAKAEKTTTSPDAGPAVGSQRPTTRSTSGSSEGACLSILLVEDHRDLGAITVELLEKAGHDVRLAVSGREAVELASETRFDLVLCDLNLPDMTGIETVRRIREASSPEPFCVALSAYDLDSFEDVGNGVFDHYASKPLDWKAVSSAFSRGKR